MSRGPGQLMRNILEHLALDPRLHVSIHELAQFTLSGTERPPTEGEYGSCRRALQSLIGLGYVTSTRETLVVGVRLDSNVPIRATEIRYRITPSGKAYIEGWIERERRAQYLAEGIDPDTHTWLPARS